jgi:hypothetical protein
MPKVSIEGLPAQVEAGKPLTLRVRALDPTGAVSPAITVTARLVGPVTLEIPLRSVGGGVYEATLPALREGDYRLVVEASMPVIIWKAVGTATQSFRVVAVGLGPAPTPTTPTPEIKPVEISIGGITIAISSPPPPGSPTAAATQPKLETPKVEAREPELGFSYAAIAIAVLSLVVAGVGVLLRRS